MSNGIVITVSFNGLCFFSSKDFPCGLLRIWHDFPVGMTAYFCFFMGYVTDDFNDDGLMILMMMMMMMMMAMNGVCGMVDHKGCLALFPSLFS